MLKRNMIHAGGKYFKFDPFFAVQPTSLYIIKKVDGWTLDNKEYVTLFYLKRLILYIRDKDAISIIEFVKLVLRPELANQIASFFAPGMQVILLLLYKILMKS